MMKALVKYEPGEKRVRLEQVPIPEPGPGYVRIKVQYTGICGTDIHIYLDDGGYKTNPPVTLGHEFSGKVDAVGDGVDASLVGKQVISETYYYTCGRCNNCKTGYINLCAERRSIGSGANGAFAEYVVVPEIKVHVLPSNVDLREAALTEPLACCVQAVLEKGGVLAGDNVLITGPGAIGLMTLQAAVLCGGRVVVAGTARDTARLELAMELGADKVVYTDSDNLRQAVLDAFDGCEPDIVFECAGAGPAINMALDLIRKGGRYIQVGLTGKPTTLDMNLITLKELDVIGTFAQKPVWWTRALELLAQEKLKLAPLISDIVRLDDWQEAFESYHKGEGLKYLLTPNGIQ